MVVCLRLVAFLKYQDDTGTYHFVADDDESAKKAAQHGLPDDIRVKHRNPLVSHIGKRVVIHINCSHYKYTSFGVTREGTRVTKLVSICNLETSDHARNT